MKITRDDLSAVEVDENAYARAVADWLALSGANAETFYRERVFPLSCRRVATARATEPPRELLFVPVGTQPFAPILAVVGTPARCVALLESPESAPFGEEVAAALAELSETAFLHIRIRETDIVDIGTAMKAVWASRGLPSPERVAADITGGRKTMTAAVAGLASGFGWQLLYVEGRMERAHSGLSHHEQIVALPNVLEVFGAVRRERALDLLEAGALHAASAALDDVIAESTASARDESLRSFARGALALRQGQPRRCAVHTLDAAHGLNLALGEAGMTLLRSCLRSPRTPESRWARVGLLALAARALEHERLPCEARARVTEARQLLAQAIGKRRAGGAGGAARILACRELKPHAAGLAVIDALIGRGLSGSVRDLR